MTAAIHRVVVAAGLLTTGAFSDHGLRREAERHHQDDELEHSLHLQNSLSINRGAGSVIAVTDVAGVCYDRDGGRFAGCGRDLWSNREYERFQRQLSLAR